MNIVNGGEHADNNVDIQEFMIMPVMKVDSLQTLVLTKKHFKQSLKQSKKLASNQVKK
ncbi:hypothetical protein CGLO_14447 [Colletotrichum gloeosporioides Cg-14]|uniref:phosphopyruvate hydratase n=1 Tax=Colletotrichum gloeosporioides (strain Cg-14) TaxID=1237896 RepID=T0L4N6_COLGC|nr:hypothetical protein CGLO_14447 [Colletotrichum gloeosporioides Cg-14]